MSITLTRDAELLDLPEDLVWVDELTWSAVSQSKERGIFGTLVVDAMARDGGRPITLQGEGNSAWIKRGVLKKLKSWADLPGQRFTLNVRSEIFTVIFDHGEEEQTHALAMQSVIEYSDKEDDDYYCSLVLRFIEASEIP
jgi:hypothetical protein